MQLFIQREGQRDNRRLQQIVEDFAALKVALIGDAGEQQQRMITAMETSSGLSSGMFSLRASQRAAK